MSPAAEKPSKLSDKTLIPLGLVVAMLVPGFGTVLWLQSRLQSIEFALQSVQETQAQIRSELKNGHASYVTWREIRAWIQINRAKGVELEDLPPH